MNSERTTKTAREAARRLLFMPVSKSIIGILSERQRGDLAEETMSNLQLIRLLLNGGSVDE